MLDKVEARNADLEATVARLAQGRLIHVDHDHACCGRKNDRAESASVDSCAIPATSGTVSSSSVKRRLLNRS